MADELTQSPHWKETTLEDISRATALWVDIIGIEVH